MFGLGLTNYQVLLMAAVPLAIIILLKNIRLFRDFLLILIPFALTAQVLQIGSKARASAVMGADVINKFEPVLLAESCPNEVLLWIAFALVIAAPVAGLLLAALTKRRQTALYGALGMGLAGVALIALANTVFAETPLKVETIEQLVDGLKGGTLSCTWTDPTFAPLIQPAKYAWIALFLAAGCVLSLGAVFAPDEARFADRRVWTWLAGAGAWWTFPTTCLIVGLVLLVVLSLLTPRMRGLAFALPVAAVQGTVFILLHKGAMNGLTHPTTWWFFWPCIWNFVLLGLATVTLPNGRSIAPAMLFAELGVSFYAYMPVVSDLRNPPMNWGYPRTWEGFKHAILRGQYEQIKMPSIFSKDGFELFCKQMGFYFQDLRMQFTLVAAALALIPFALWKGVVKTKDKVVNVPAARIAVGLYVATAALVVVFSELFESWTDGEVPARLDKLLLVVLALLALVGVGAMFVRQALVVIGMIRGQAVAPHEPRTTNHEPRLSIRFLADDVTQQWLIAVGSCFAIMSFFLVALANVKGDIQDGFIQKVKFISSHGMFSLWIGYGLVVGLVVANRFAARFVKADRTRRLVFGILCAGAACVALIPIYENYTNDKLVFAMGSAEQNGHTFGWQFGNYQLRGARGANAIREELLPDEEPLPNPLWPEEMEPSSIFFGGTDPGRFVPTYMIYSADVRPDVYLITQNALADDTYMSVERDLYGDEIWIPSKNDSAEAFNIYVTEVQSGKRAANADLVIENGRVQVTGALGVMEINGVLTRMMFDQERLRHAFYVEESYVIPWMYEYLTPHGLIMKINAEKDSLNDVIVRNDMEFWDWYTRRLMKDPAFRRDFPAQKSFSKLRAAIAGLYANTRNRSRDGNGYEKYGSLTAQAFREAVALYPASPEATFRYIQEVIGQSGKWDALIDIVSYTDRVDPNNVRTKDILKNACAARDAANAMNAILRKHVAPEATVPDATRAPFPAEVLKKLSAEELDELAEARLAYAEANLMFNRLQLVYQSLVWLQSNPAHDKTFARLWRPAQIFDRLGRYQEAGRLIKEALKFQEINTFDNLRVAAEILARAGQREDCAKAINAAMQFPEAQNFDTLIRYASVFLRLGDANQAVQYINRALPLKNATTSAMSLIAAAEILLQIDRNTYRDVIFQYFLNDLTKRRNLTPQEVEAATAISRALQGGAGGQQRNPGQVPNPALQQFPLQR